MVGVFAVMFKKINAVFRPSRDPSAREDYHSACTVKLVRSASMLAVGERNRAHRDSTLKRSASAISVQSSTALYYYHSREERVWFYSQNQECLEYLQELVALRRRYTKSVSDLKQGERRAQTSSKKKHAPQPPQVRKSTNDCLKQGFEKLSQGVRDFYYVALEEIAAH